MNQEQVRFQGGLSVPLRDDDEIYIVPMISGGGQQACGGKIEVETLDEHVCRD